MDERLSRFLTLLESDNAESVGTSVRLPADLREAVGIAVELGLAESTTELTTQGLRSALEAIAMRAVLDAHYAEYPAARPDLAEIAYALAQMEAHPLAQRLDLIERAAREIHSVRPDATPDDVLSYAAGLAAGLAAAVA
ncbi:MAG: hypothetical protein ACT4P1_12000 [Sporichthyaceae bacterium]